MVLCLDQCLILIFTPSRTSCAIFLRHVVQFSCFVKRLSPRYLWPFPPNALVEPSFQRTPTNFHNSLRPIIAIGCNARLRRRSRNEALDFWLSVWTQTSRRHDAAMTSVVLGAKVSLNKRIVHWLIATCLHETTSGELLQLQKRLFSCLFYNSTISLSRGTFVKHLKGAIKPQMHHTHMRTYVHTRVYT